MKRPLGICSWIFGHHEYKKIAGCLESYGFDGVELMTDIYLQDPLELAGVFSNHGLRFFSMTPANVDIADVDPRKRKKAISYYKDLIDFAAELNSPAITCHEHVGRREPHDNRDDEWKRIVDSCRDLSIKARDKKIRVVFEPLNRGIVSSITDSGKCLDLIREINSPFFGIVLDTFHMDKEEADPCKAIEESAGFLRLFQIADSNRKGIGLGEIDFAGQFRTLDKIGYRRPLIVECALGIKGPSLNRQKVDFKELDRSIKMTVAWIKNNRSV
jgi:sugar phosphate isomerase/epimerase